MALDYEKVVTAEPHECIALALCEFSRFVDAHERLAAALARIAPDAELQPGAEDVATEVPTCPHPAELRVSVSTMGEEPYSTFRCGVCQALVRQQPVEA